MLPLAWFDLVSNLRVTVFNSEHSVFKSFHLHRRISEEYQIWMYQLNYKKNLQDHRLRKDMYQYIFLLDCDPFEGKLLILL